jgi:hypothetical protein
MTITPTPRHLQVGEPSPLASPPDFGMVIDVQVGVDTIIVVCVIGIAGLRRHERKRFLRAPVTVARLDWPPLIWFTVSSGGFAFDGSFAPSLSGPGWYADVLLAARYATRRDFVVTVVDDQSIVLRNHRMITTPETWAAIGDAIAACPADHDAAAYHEALADDQARWSPSEMHALAKIGAPRHPPRR